jgi:hypothetical protein
LKGDGCANKAFDNIDEKKTEKKKNIRWIGHFTNVLGNNIEMWSGIHKSTK